jgi:hypothetical protein
MPRGVGPSPAQHDATELRLAARELEAATEMLAAAHQVVDTHARREAIATAVAKLELASRTIDMVVDRRST